MGGAPSDVLLRYFLKIVGHRGAGINGNVGMDAVIREPEFYIPDADVRRGVLNLSACRAYALVYRVVPLLEGKGITRVLQWRGSYENAGAKREVRDELGDDMLWNMTCGLLDGAFYAARDADARERVERESWMGERKGES
ncbi:putative retrotransposon hot spot protein 4 (RHS4) [Trypanosoma vivax]|nr:putative retrotransposon hot spot protein 4 (RHS4) [Trypanosoma vivax]